MRRKVIIRGRTPYYEYDFGSHERMDDWAGEKLGEDWVERVNRPGTKAGTGRWHYHKYHGLPVIEDTRKGRLYLRKDGEYK